MIFGHLYNIDGDQGDYSGNAAVEKIEFVEDNTPVYFDLQGRRVNNPEKGIYIVRRGNKVTKEYIR